MEKIVESELRKEPTCEAPQIVTLCKNFAGETVQPVAGKSMQVLSGADVRTSSGEAEPSVAKEDAGKPSAPVDEATMAAVNRFARRSLSPEEVYLFDVILCDNEIDRTNECFTVQALEKMAALFIGRTGITNHAPVSENQTARLFAAQVTAPTGRRTAAGQPYRALRGRAYMVRTASNADLIAEIDGGIKKEVSVSVAAQVRRCSICGVNRLEQSCDHVPGHRYGGRLCYQEIDGISDAYEWSFVAIPAQRGAGVTKTYALPDELSTFECGIVENEVENTAAPAENAGAAEPDAPAQTTPVQDALLDTARRIVEGEILRRRFYAGETCGTLVQVQLRQMTDAQLLGCCAQMPPPAQEKNVQERWAEAGENMAYQLAKTSRNAGEGRDNEPYTYCADHG